MDCDDFLNQYIRDAADKIPVMLINASMSYPNIYSVACDDRKAIYEATQWLYRTGSENVLFVYNQKSYSGIRKLAGFHEAARHMIKTGTDTVYTVPMKLQMCTI